MKERLKKYGQIFRKPRYSIPAFVLLIIIFVIIGKIAAPKKPAYEVRAAERVSVIQEVDATGNVKSAEAVDLAFETGGKLARINVKIGDRVKAGERLASLSNADAAANFASAEARLAQLETGSRPEDLAVSAASVSSAEASLSNAAASLSNAINDSYVKADDAIHNHSDQLFSSPRTNPSFGTTVTSGGTTYVLQASDASTALRLSNERISAESILNSWPVSSSNADVSIAADDAEADLLKLQSFLNDVASSVNGYSSPNQATSDVYAGVKSEVATARTGVSAALASLRTAIQAYSSAQASLDVSNKQEILKQAPATREDVAIQEAAVETARALYSKTVLNAPFSGIVTKVGPSVGEIVNPNSSTVSLIADSKLEVEVNIPEADIPKVVLGAEAEVTFDAYGKDFVATSTVVSIDPAATVIEGVPTYRTVLAFSSFDSRIKPGLTTNVIIHGARKDDVVAIPQRSVLTKNGQKIVQVVEGQTIIEKPVETGLRGSDGNVEIVSGLSAGEHYVVTPAAK